jgi:hypothetical protein
MIKTFNLLYWKEGTNPYDEKGFGIELPNETIRASRIIVKQGFQDYLASGTERFELYLLDGGIVFLRNRRNITPADAVGLFLIGKLPEGVTPDGRLDPDIRLCSRSIDGLQETTKSLRLPFDKEEVYTE